MSARCAFGDLCCLRPAVNGSVLCCRYKDLFEAMPNSLGSFGYILRLRMRIQKTRPFVHIQKTWVDTPKKFIDALNAACDKERGHDFVDGVAISEQGGVVVTGDFVNSPPSGVSASKYCFKQFYPTLMVEGDDYLEVTDYIWRWDADWFWVTQIFPMMGWGWIRFLTGSQYLRSDMYKIFNDHVMLLVAPLTRNQELVIQDIEVPLDKSAEWIHLHLQACPSISIGKIKLGRPGKELGVPIWICPVLGTASPLMPMDAGKMYMVRAYAF